MNHIQDNCPYGYDLLKTGTGKSLHKCCPSENVMTGQNWGTYCTSATVPEIKNQDENNSNYKRNECSHTKERFFQDVHEIEKDMRDGYCPVYSINSVLNTYKQAASICNVTDNSESVLKYFSCQPQCQQSCNGPNNKKYSFCQDPINFLKFCKY